jgi:hypothetical protein
MGWNTGPAGPTGPTGPQGPSGVTDTSFGEVSRRSGTPATITLTTAGTFYKWTDSAYSTSSGASDITASTATDDLTIGADGRGWYRAQISVSFSGSGNALVHGAICVNTTPVIQFERKLGTGGDVGTATCGGFVLLEVGDVVDVRFSADSNNKTVTPEHCGLTLLRVGT